MKSVFSMISCKLFELEVPVYHGLSMSRHVLKFHSKIPNYYEILGVPETADKKLIKEAFKKLSKKHHPDRSGLKSSQAEYLKIREAYSVLNESLSRREYDLKLRSSHVNRPKSEPMAPHYPHYSQPKKDKRGFEWQYGYWQHHAHKYDPPDNSDKNADNKILALSMGLFIIFCGMLISVLRYYYVRNSVKSHYDYISKRNSILYEEAVERGKSRKPSDLLKSSDKEE